MSPASISQLARRLAAAAAIAVVATSSVSAAPAISGSVTTEVGPFERTELTVTDGDGPLDRFKIVRLVRKSGPTQPQALLLLPPLGVKFGFYEQPDTHGGISTSIAGFFARRGFDVWGYVARTEGIPAGSCEAGIVDCSAMATWDLARWVDDVRFARDVLEAESPGAQVVVGGASLGAMIALGVLDDDPTRYAGALLWEGMLASADPAVQELNQGYCAQLEAALEGGSLFDAAGAGVAREVARQVELAPEGLTPVPVFPPALTNRQALVSLFSAPPPGPTSQPVPGYLALAGDPGAGSFDFASTRRVIANLEQLVSYSPNATLRDVSCSLAGTETAYTDDLGAFTGRVLALGGGRGFGPYMQDTLDLLTGAIVTLRIEDELGHIDHFMSPNHREFVEWPVLAWLKSF